MSLRYFGSSGGGSSPLLRPENIVHQTMKMATPSASSSSSRINHMVVERACRGAACAAILGLAIGCTSLPPQAGAPVEERSASTAVAAALLAPPLAEPSPIAEPRVAAPPPRTDRPEPAARRPRSRWVPAAWSDLPGWNDDRAAEVWPALLAGCTRPLPGWNEACARALLEPPAGHEAARRWLSTHLQPYRVEAPDGTAEGLITGYFEPTLEASRRRSATHRVPLYAPPSELATRKPFYTRQQLETLPAAMATLRGQEIAWVEDPLDALLLQVQGSGRLRFVEPDGRRSTVRLAFAAHNEQPYKSLGRWLIDQGEMTLETASWPAIKAWAQKNPRRVQEMLWANPRVVFFREEPLPDLNVGPKGALAVPLTPGRSIAVDPQSIPYGTAVWIDTTEPLSATPLRRLVMAQDGGGAITGAVRADYFWGWGATAEAQAGRMKQPLRMWVLWPKGATLE